MHNRVRTALVEFQVLDGHISPVTDVTSASGELPADELIHSDVRLAGLVDRLTWPPSTRREAAAEVLAAHWSWLISLPARATWAMAHIVPDVHPANVAFLSDEHGVPEVALLKSDRYGCLSGHPAADSKDAIVFASTQTLNAWWLGRVLDLHLDPMLRRLQRVSGATPDSLQQAVAAGFTSARDTVATTVLSRFR